MYKMLICLKCTVINEFYMSDEYDVQFVLYICNHFFDNIG
jgi:hypothetical protein